MRFKKAALLSSLSFLAVSILVPPRSSVNGNAAPDGTKRTETADGMPLPPLPPGGKAISLVADGMPLPPLPPKNVTELAADGMPLPPLPPNSVGILPA